jgi:hypothetical protein
MEEAEIDDWLGRAPAAQVRAAHTEAELAIAEWKRRLCRPEESCLLSINVGLQSRSLAAAAGRAAIELAILVSRHHEARKGTERWPTIPSI